MRRGRRIVGGALAVWIGLVLWHGAGDTTTHTPQPERCAAGASPDATLLLVGDAGAPRTPEPLLDALAREAAEAVAALGRERVAIAFLGDNVYPHGLRAPDHPDRARDEARLLSQLAVVRSSGARGWFVPGNHDWENGGDAGWEAMQRATRFVAARGAQVVPPNGCPGPVVLPLGASAMLVFLDTQWWLHTGPKPQGDDSPCAAAREGDVGAALASALRDAGSRRHAIVLAHHPLVSGGPHGVRFGWKEHFFPFREAHRLAWLPMPIIGSIWPLLRIAGASDQDLPGTAYRHMIESIDSALGQAPPLVFAAGHDHTLQLIRGATARFHLVSGAGSAGNLTWVHPVAGTLYAAVASGWARLDFDRGGAVEASFRTLDGTGAPALAYRACLTP